MCSSALDRWLQIHRCRANVGLLMGRDQCKKQYFGKFRCDDAIILRLIAFHLAALHSKSWNIWYDYRHTRVMIEQEKVYLLTWKAGVAFLLSVNKCNNDGWYSLTAQRCQVQMKDSLQRSTGHLTNNMAPTPSVKKQMVNSNNISRGNSWECWPR